MAGTEYHFTIRGAADVSADNVEIVCEICRRIVAQVDKPVMRSLNIALEDLLLRCILHHRHEVR